MSRGASVLARTRVAAEFAVVLISLTGVAHCSNNESEVRCSKTCVAENCNSVGIRYGKFCGVGWTGCPGEKPCDDLDACCKIHDECVAKKGLINIKCHEKFKNCIKKVQKSGKVGFSRTCPYETAVPTMVQEIERMPAKSGNLFYRCEKIIATMDTSGSTRVVHLNMEDNVDMMTERIFISDRVKKGM